MLAMCTYISTPICSLCKKTLYIFFPITCCGSLILKCNSPFFVLDSWSSLSFFPFANWPQLRQWTATATPVDTLEWRLGAFLLGSSCIFLWCFAPCSRWYLLHCNDVQISPTFGMMVWASSVAPSCSSGWQSDCWGFLLLGWGRCLSYKCSWLGSRIHCLFETCSSL